jgi:hypothetical protein
MCHHIRPEVTLSDKFVEHSFYLSLLEVVTGPQSQLEQNVVSTALKAPWLSGTTGTREYQR